MSPRYGDERVLRRVCGTEAASPCGLTGQTRQQTCRANENRKPPQTKCRLQKRRQKENCITPVAWIAPFRAELSCGWLRQRHTSLPISIEAMHATLTRGKVGQYHHGQPSLLGSRLKTTLSLDSPAMCRWSTTGVVGTIGARSYAVVAQ